MDDAHILIADLTEGIIGQILGDEATEWEVVDPRETDPGVVTLTVKSIPRRKRNTESFPVVYSMINTDAEATLSLADQLQDGFVELIGRYRGLALPPCPGHVHPMTSSLREGIPVWECPQGQTVIPITKSR